ncbi:hypothetical protein RGUI_3435 [Rhodovulum sp. P5]|nr:hypothetical protein RGUI_3435 [Rhodovulum sp. P5]
MTIAAAAPFAFPISAAAGGCTFRGEIVYAEDFPRIVIDRADPEHGGQALGPHAPLYPGDVLLVQGDQVAWIRDEPGGDLREITAGDGRVTIGQPETCDVHAGFAVTLRGLYASLNAIIGGPVTDQPIVTYPRRGDPAPGGLKLAFGDGQLLAAGTEFLSVSWTGLDAEVALRSTTDDTVLINLRSAGVPLVEGAIERPLQPGEALRLEFETEKGRVTRTIRVVPRGDLPKPAGVESLDDLTPAEATIYAIWLATEGPPEWRLQGMSLLARAARDDYMAWKVLRGLRSEPPG